MANTNGAGYRIDMRPPHDRDVQRNRATRLINCAVSSALLVAVPTAFGSYWGRILGGYELFGGLIGFGIATYLCASWIPKRMLVIVPQWTAFVTTNLFDGAVIPYGPGLHCSHWWEQRDRSGNYPLQILTNNFDVSISTQTAAVTVTGAYEYSISLPYITRAIGLDDTTVERGITTFMKSFLTSKCAAQSAEQIRGSIDVLNRNLADEFMATEGTEAENPSSMERSYGFRTVSVVLNSISLPAAVQKTRDAIDTAAALHQVVATLFGVTPQELVTKLQTHQISIVDYNSMLNRAMAASGNAKMTINVVEAAIPALIAKLRLA